MAKGWSKNRRCPICYGAGWGNNKCRGFLHQDGSTVFCEHPDQWDSSTGYEKSDTVISPFGIPLTCFRKVLE